MLEVKLLRQIRVQRGGTPIAAPARRVQPLPAIFLLTCSSFYRRVKLARHFRPDRHMFMRRYRWHALLLLSHSTQGSLSRLGVEHSFQLPGSVTRRIPNVHRLLAHA